MPTPFMHLALAYRLRYDRALPAAVTETLGADPSAWGAFLLGSIAPDARLTSGTARANTHFYHYGPVIDPRPALAMLSQYPELGRRLVSDAARRAFVAGYLGHLTMDEIWCTDLLFPAFIGQWADQKTRMLLFHILLGVLDDRDRNDLPDDTHSALSAASPRSWLPFISDGDLSGWRDTVATQLSPGGQSQTLGILGKVIGLSADELGAAIRDDTHMNRLWAQLDRQQLDHIERRMYSAVSATIQEYLCS